MFIRVVGRFPGTFPDKWTFQMHRWEKRRQQATHPGAAHHGLLDRALERVEAQKLTA